MEILTFSFSWFIGLTSDITAFPTGDDHLNAKNGFMFYKTSANNFRIGMNDGVGATGFSSDIATADTNTHTIILRANETGTKFSYSWDFAPFIDFTTNIPASTTGLGLVCSVENNAAVSRKMRLDIMKYISFK